MYIRLSREDGDKQESESIGNQRKIIERYLKEQNLNIVDEYVDDEYLELHLTDHSLID